MAGENKITVLTNNVILIGFTTETNDGVLIEKPFSIQGGNGQPFQLAPFLEAHIGQNIPATEFKDFHVLTSVKADKNDLLDGYLQQISGIDLGVQSIIT